jgi:Flp pilus assembly protein CpaB
MSGRPFTILGAIIAVVALGAFLYFGSRSSGGAGLVPSTVNQKPIVVASHDIQTRVPLTTSDLKIIKVDAAAVPPQSFDKVEQLKGLIPVLSIAQGQPVTGNMLVASSDQVTGAQAAFLPIPKGYVALTIPTGEQQGVAGFIQPGDYIAIQAIMAHGALDNTRTVFTNVHVIRTGVANQSVTAVQAGKPAPPTTTTSGVSSSLTVVVTQCQAEYINWFIANGSLKYTLESYRDYTPKDVSVDPTCPGVEAAGGVTIVQVVQKWPGFLN